MSGAALSGIGIEAVLARSYSFIFNRNMRTLGLLGFTITDEAFYEAVADGEEIEVNVASQRVAVAGKVFRFELSDIERELIARRGAVEGYKLLGRDLWEQLTKSKSDRGVESGTAAHQMPIGVLEKETTGKTGLEW